MPIQVIVTEGILSSADEKEVFAAITDAFLTVHNLAGNAFLTPNVIGEVTTVPKGRTFSGGQPADIAVVELKVPAFALASLEQKQRFVAEATEIVLNAANGRLARERIFVNMVYAVDGLWGIGGTAYTNDHLLQAVSDAAPVAA